MGVVINKLSDETAKVSNVDTTPGYLFDKVVPGNGIDTAIVNPAANETLSIAVDETELTGLSIPFALTAGSVVFSNGTNLAQDNSNFFWDNTNKRLGIRVAPQFTLHVDGSSTVTSGTDTVANFTRQLAPATNSTATQIFQDIVGTTASSSSNKANAIIMSRHLFSRSGTDSGNIVSLTGTASQVLNTAIFGTTTGSVGTMTAHSVQVSDNSSTTTATTAMYGVNSTIALSTNLSASRVITTMAAGYFSLSTNAAAGTTITNASVLILDPTVSANKGGTYTNPLAVDIVGWSSSAGTGAGVTFTNAPEQLRLRTMSIANSIAIRQQGSTPHSRFEGNVMIGADSAPSYPLHVYKTTGTSEGVVQSGTVILNARANTSGSGTALLGTTSNHTVNLVANSSTFISLVAGFYTQLSQDVVPSGTVTIGRSALPFSAMYAEDFYISNGIGQEIRHGANIIASSYTINWPSSQGAVGTVPQNDGSGNLTWATIPGAQDTMTFNGAVINVGGNSTIGVDWGGGGGDGDVVMPYACTVKAISIGLNTARTAGTCTLRWLKNGVVQSETVVIDGTNTQYFRRVLTTPVSLAAGDRINLQTVTASFTPTGGDATCAIFIER